METIISKEVNSPVGSLYPAARGDILLSCRFGQGPGPAGDESLPVLEAVEQFISGYFGKLPMKLSLEIAGKSRKVSHELSFFTERAEGKKNIAGLGLKLDLSAFTEREFDVYKALLSVPCGEVISYGALAARAGIPRGGRFAGNAMAKNSFPLIIPCHRVVKADGSTGNYTSGPWKKVFLLEHEKNEIQS